MQNNITKSERKTLLLMLLLQQTATTTTNFNTTTTTTTTDDTTDISSLFFAVDSAPMAVGLFRLRTRQSGTRYQTNSDPACSFDSFRQFLKTILFSLYYSVRYALYKSTFYLLTRLLTYDYYYYYYHSFSIASDSGSVHK